MLELRLLNERDDKGRNLYKLLSDYNYPLGVDTVITVPKGYITNFGTIPRWAYWIITPAEMREAAVVHDFLANEKFTLNQEPSFSRVPRRVADAILYDHMIRIGIDRFRAYFVYAGVRFWAIYTRQL